MSIAMVDYGMGNRRSVVKAFEHVGSAIAQTADHDELRAADGLVVPGVGAFPEAMRRLRALGLDEIVRERAAAGVRSSACASGCSCCSTARRSTRDPPGSASCPGGSCALDTRGLKSPHIGWNSVTWQRDVGARRGLAEPGRVLPRALVRRAACRRRDRARHGRVRVAVRVLRAARQRLRRPVPSREVLHRGPRAAAQLRRDLRDRARDPRRSCDPLSRDRHRRRPGGAARAGRLRRRDGLRRQPVRSRAGLGRGGRSVSARHRPRRRSHRVAAEPAPPREDRGRARRSRADRRRPEDDRSGPRRDRRGRGARHPRHRGVH